MKMFTELLQIGRGLLRVLRLMPRGHFAALTATLLLLVGIGVLSNVPAIVLGWIVDRLEGEASNNPVDLLFTVVAAFFGAITVREGLQIIRKLLVENACTKTEKSVRVSAMRQLLEVDLGFYRHQMSGAIQGRLNRSIEGLVRLIKLVFLDLGPTTFVAATAVALALQRHVGMGALMALVIPTGLALVMAQVNSQKGIRIALLRGKEAIDGTIVELLGNIESVRAIHSIDFETDRVANVSEDLRRTEMRHHVAMALFDSAKQFNEVAFHALVLGLSVYLAAKGEISTGDVVTLSMLFSGVVAPLREVHRIIDEAHESTIRVRDLFEILDQPRDRSFIEVNAPGMDNPAHCDTGEVLNSTRPAIAVSGLCVRYPGEKHNVLHDVDIDVQCGEFVGICGPAGCGKSTLLKAILRLIHPSTGMIELLGRPIETWARHEIAETVAYVGQKPFLIDGTIEENIAYGVGDVSRNLVIEAAKLANIHEEVIRMPGGYKYHVGESGSGLSGGQQQRVALARVFLRSPKVMLLDEATSSLDSLNERIVQNALERAMAGRTVIAVAHRLNTLRNADRIVVLNQGTVVETGSYGDLAGANGLFSQFVMAGNKTPA